MTIYTYISQNIKYVGSKFYTTLRGEIPERSNKNEINIRSTQDNIPSLT